MDNLGSYTKFSKYYNLMMKHRNHYRSIADLLSYFIPKSEMKILDAACGQGNPFYFDISENWTLYGNDGCREMLVFLQADYLLFLKYKAVYNYNWEHLRKIFETERDFDLIFFLGNSISHIDNIGILERILRDAYEAIAEKGSLLFDIRNWQYDSVKASLYEVGRTKNVKRKLLEDSIDDNQIAIYDNCYYESGRQIIEYFIEENGNMTDRISFSYLMIPQNLLYEMLSDLSFEISFSGKHSSYPYYIFLAKKGRIAS